MHAKMGCGNSAEKSDNFEELTISRWGCNVVNCSPPVCLLRSAMVSFVCSCSHFRTCSRVNPWMGGRVGGVGGVARVPQDPVDGRDRRNGRSVTDLLSHQLTKNKCHKTLTSSFSSSNLSISSVIYKSNYSQTWAKDHLRITTTWP